MGITQLICESSYAGIYPESITRLICECPFAGMTDLDPSVIPANAGIHYSYQTLPDQFMNFHTRESTNIHWV
jgi:hypothetical protein